MGSDITYTECCFKMIVCVRAVFLGLVLALATAVESDVTQQAVAGAGILVDESDATERDERGIAMVDTNQEIGRGRILGQVSTTTLWSVSVSTSTVHFSCLSGISTQIACGGRRRKRRMTRKTIQNIVDNVNPAITSSFENINEKEQEKDLEKSEKLFGFTVWTAVTASSTVTVFSTNTASTIRMSYYCTAALADTPGSACSG